MSDFEGRRVTPDDDLAVHREWVSRNGHHLCTCGDKYGDHYADLNGCAACIECPGFTLDRDRLIDSAFKIVFSRHAVALDRLRDL